MEQPIEKVATRNMFYDEKGNHVRTKKEILDEEGNIRKRCKVIHKGEVYERQISPLRINTSRLKISLIPSSRIIPILSISMCGIKASG